MRFQAIARAFPRRDASSFFDCLNVCLIVRARAIAFVRRPPWTAARRDSTSSIDAIDGEHVGFFSPSFWVIS